MSSPYRQNDIDLRNKIIEAINEHYKLQGGEKMLRVVKLKIKQVGNDLDHSEIEMTWKYNNKKL